MSDNVAQTLQKLIQDVIAPDVRETKVRLESLSRETAVRFDGIQTQIASLEKAILAAIAGSRAQTELAGMSAIADVRERIAVLESKHN